jgi:predicted DCC family thiol-disulfide oxidoreductase YuxK
MPQNTSPIEGKTVVFFDGVCNLCNGTVNWLIDHDPHQHLLFSPLQGTTFASIKENAAPYDLSTIVLWDKGRLLTHSKAVLHILIELGGIWRIVARVGLIVPAFLRDALYGMIARNRYQWFGKQQQCRLPTSEVAARFLP